MTVLVNATVTYACYLTKEQEDMVRKYQKENSPGWGEMSLEDAVMGLYSDVDSEFELYKNSEESDFSTEEVIKVIEREENDER